MDIKELVGKSKNKDREAFSELFDFYYDKIFNYVFRRTLNIDYAKDITSNTFLKVLKYLNDFKWKGGDNSFNAWIYKIATNEINQYFRKQNKYKLIVDEENFKELGDCGETVREIENRLENDEYLLILNKGMKQLKPIYQDILHLRYFEELSYEEISKILSKNETTIRVYSKRALEKLKLILEKDALVFKEN
ncbi:MAG TPA: RNA polymerase sigma factor [Candidatus Pacearchaeota archaeon]|nr:RNA polymerase sigma factor [Candidatus Pacearchaeota archaeon]